jgi:hypothetical protein
MGSSPHRSLVRALDYIFNLRAPASLKLHPLLVERSAYGRAMSTRGNEVVVALDEEEALGLGRVAWAGTKVGEESKDV